VDTAATKKETTQSSTKDIDIKDWHTTHPTQRVVIVEAEVDIDIIPLINWMNNLRGIRTLYCCQGTDDPRIPIGAGNTQYSICNSADKSLYPFR